MFATEYTARRPNKGFALAAGLGAACLAMILSGCGAEAFPRELFTIDAEGADYPFMLSEVPDPKGKSREIDAESGTSAEYSQSTYGSGSSRVTVTTSSESESELSAAVKLAAKVRRNDRYLLLKKATFTASNMTASGGGTVDRHLEIEATAYR